MPCYVTEKQLIAMRRQCKHQDEIEYIDAMLEKYYGGYGLYSLVPEANPNNNEQHNQLQ